MGSRTKFADLVVVVPGVFGSRLSHHGVPLWGDSSAGFLPWVRTRGADLGHLSVGADDPSLEDLGDGIVADALIDGFYVVGRFVKVGGYAALTRSLQTQLSLKLGENLQLFAYDWRRDLRVSTRRLATKVEGWLHAWRSRSGNRNAKVVLICHAMGGLVGHAYAEIEGGWPAIRTIVSIGSPFLGSIRALDLLYFGLDFQSYSLPIHDLTVVVRTLTSVYQLLPSYPAIRTFDGRLVSPFEIRIPTFEHHKIERARQFHRDLVEHHTRNRSAPGHEQMSATSIIGVGQGTVETGKLLPNGTLAIEREAGADAYDGDGTVPRFSAEAPAPTGFEGQWLYLPQTHGMLASDPLVHAHLCDLLKGGSSGSTPPATALPRFTLRRAGGNLLRIDPDALSVAVAKPFYKVGQPVEVRIGAQSAGGHPFGVRSMKLSAKLEQIGYVGRRLAAQPLRLSPDRKRPGSWIASFRASAPGTFRVTVASNHRLLAPFRVCDFFEVDAGK